MTDNKPRHGSKARKWQTNSFAHFPFRVVFSLIVSGLAIGAAVAVLVVADGSPIDSWPLAPTVILSILVTTSGDCLRRAFSEGSDLYWWSKLLSRSGVRLADLHTMWKLSHRTFSLLQFPARRAPQYLLRLSAFLVKLLVITGPLLQRALTIESSIQVRNLDATLPVRRQPMWNLTTKPIDVRSRVDSLPPYQPEVMELASELNLRQPIALPYPVCHQNATCTTNVTIAGFGWDCEDKEVDPWNITSLIVAKAITTNDWNKGELVTYACEETGFHAAPNSSQTTYDASSPTDDYCGNLVSDFQMSFSREQDADYLTYGESPTFAYATYLRKDQSTQKLSVRQCNFTTSFIELSIRIVNEKIVTLIPPSKDDSGSSPPKSRNVIERIPFGWETLRTEPLINAFGQIMADTYSGYMLYDTIWASHLSLGMNVRQYVNQSSIGLRDSNDYYDDRTSFDGYGFTMLDPFDDFVATLNEVCLRYAIKSIEQSVERLREFTGYLGKDSGDVRDKVESQMVTTFSEQQQVQMEESLELAVYKSHHTYLAAAAGITYLALLFTLLLVGQVFSSHGRKVSFSPLEVAKAFNAPLLADVGSNLEADDIAETLTDVRVKYGEAMEDAKSPYEDMDDYKRHSPSLSVSTSVSDYSSMLARDETLKLRIDVADRVSKPGRGRPYY